MTSTQSIRQTFLSYFEERDHTVVSSSGLVPSNDPTLLFTNAGMVQFKNVFTGLEKRPYKRAVTAQKCLRAGGKHNDLENVGYTARHHTFFEMLGNFSFGDYFKDEAITHAWTLLTKDFALPREKLWVTVFSEDEEAASLWKKIAGLSDDRIIRIPTSDNFWSMGDTGPCGPCSEIFYDHGAHIPGGLPGTPEQDGDRFVEIWNLVFMQFDQISLTERLLLPKPSIDTGMGLERLAAVLQGVHDNFDIDLFQAIIHETAGLANVDPRGPHVASLRVIADHLRAMCFLMADGVLPSNEGRGYVLRRIMRRAMRHAHRVGMKEATLFKLVPVLIAQMGGAFGELIRAQALITETIYAEEERFLSTLEKGLRLLHDETDRMKSGAMLPGATAFKLYDTFGFPLDLTQDIMRQQGLSVDTKGFDDAMDQQKADARAAWSGSGAKQDDRIWFDISQEVEPTEFVGYDNDHAQALVSALIVDSKRVVQACEGDEVTLITNQTPFYGESGGQMGDRGICCTLSGVHITIHDTQKRPGNLTVHQGVVTQGTIAQGDEVTLHIDVAYRNKLRANHSATHLLHKALHHHLGDHAVQKGSLVASDRLRFDFSFNRALTPSELVLIEDDVNNRIRENFSVETHVMAYDKAIERGVTALFGEKYGDEVRVVAMGQDSGAAPFSIELCGGTHVRATGDIGYCKIISEAGVASGVRRIEALTGEDAEHYMRGRDHTVQQVAQLLKGSTEQVVERVQVLLDERKRLEKELAQAKQKALQTSTDTDTSLKMIGAIAFVTRVLDDMSAKDLKPLMDSVRKQHLDAVIVLFAKDADKVAFVIGVPSGLTSQLSAVTLTQAASMALGGKGGGGRPDLAQGGGVNPASIPQAIEAIEMAVTAAYP